MTVCLFRCDASKDIGSGHLYRCRNLATSLKSKGFDCIFIVSNDITGYYNILRDMFPVYFINTMKASPSESTTANDILSYKSWDLTDELHDELYIQCSQR